MKLEERVAAIPIKWVEIKGQMAVDLISHGNDILKAFKEAVIEEREACAKEAESVLRTHEPYSRVWGEKIAAAIRARSTK